MRGKEIIINNSTKLNKTSNHLSPQKLRHMALAIMW